MNDYSLCLLKSEILCTPLPRATTATPHALHTKAKWRRAAIGVTKMANTAAVTNITSVDDAAKEAKALNQAKVKEVEGKSWETADRKKPNLHTPCGKKHLWKQWTHYVTHCKKFRCEREGCGFFKKCWAKCEDIDCHGCHVIAHKRWWATEFYRIFFCPSLILKSMAPSQALTIPWKRKATG